MGGVRPAVGSIVLGCVFQFGENMFHRVDAAAKISGVCSHYEVLGDLSAQDIFLGYGREEIKIQQNIRTYNGYTFLLFA